MVTVTHGYAWLRMGQFADGLEQEGRPNRRLAVVVPKAMPLAQGRPRLPWDLGLWAEGGSPERRAAAAVRPVAEVQARALARSRALVEVSR